MKATILSCLPRGSLSLWQDNKPVLGRVHHVRSGEELPASISSTLLWPTTVIVIVIRLFMLQR